MGISATGSVWIITLKVWLAFLQVLSTLDNNPGFISIDCGANLDYTDEESGIWYQTDKDFVETGVNLMVSPSSVNLNYPSFGKQLNTLRSFPEGDRNCYTLKPKQGKNNSYLIRAFFTYGNYDSKNRTPTFDLYLGLNYWDTLTDFIGYAYQYIEVIHTPSTDVIDVCLVKTGPTIPFISALELRLLNSSLYQKHIRSTPLLHVARLFDVNGAPIRPLNSKFSRYKDDIYDRVWSDYGTVGWYPRELDESIDIDPRTTDDAYKLPAQVLRTACQSGNVSNALEFNLDSALAPDRSSEYYVYFHFNEIEKLPQGKKRIINITLNSENILSKPLVLEYLKPVTVSPEKAIKGYVRFSIGATSESDAPPILNAFGIYKLVTQLSTTTDARDVGAILDIKSAYKISKLSWQGDPCLPGQYIWEGLICSSDTNPRITSLDLSSSKLTGEINISFSYITDLESLDLSNNELAGPVPEFLAELPKLRILNLTGNKLSGPIPKALKEKADNKTLQLSLVNYPDLCMTDSCKKRNFVVPLLASISALVVILLISLGIWIFKRTQKGTQPQIEVDELPLFSFEKIATATNNFHLCNMLGEGGFGPVYKGQLKDSQEIAVKRLSKVSAQGLKEFMNEVVVISKLQHRNLVRLLGCCIERNEQMLVYEFMPNKSLDVFLFDPIQRKVLDWRKRFNIIEGIARGILYLHRDSRLKIIHRDLKASNILLDEEMNPKISDFGLARIFRDGENGEVNTRRVAGTYGYMSPEYAMKGLFSEKSDVYSFGVLLLEIVSGRRNTSFYNNEQSLSLVGFAWKLWNEDSIISLIDPEIWDPCFKNSIMRCIHIGLLCVQELTKERPTISTVVLMLISEITHLPPPKQVAFVHRQNLRDLELSSQRGQGNSNNDVTLSEIQGR